MSVTHALERVALAYVRPLAAPAPQAVDQERRERRHDNEWYEDRSPHRPLR